MSVSQKSWKTLRRYRIHDVNWSKFFFIEYNFYGSVLCETDKVDKTVDLVK